jgi:uncharacterized delta-60 repeat protein
LKTHTHDTDAQLSLTFFDAAQSAVRAFVAGSATAAATAFGSRVTAAALSAAVEGFDRDGWPTLRLVDADLLHGARGAYDAGSRSIYLSREFLAAFHDSPGAVVNVLVEEIGHAVDAQVSAVDAPGDEGALFAALVSGQTLGAAALEAIRAENDHGTITLDGRASAVEFAAPIVGTVTLDGSLSDWTAADQLDQTLSTSGYDLYGKTTGNSYVFAIKAPGAIGAETTTWLNTDKNAATGYQIWDFAGGAEYNINFDASGTPRLYTGDAGQTLVSSATISFGYSADRTVVEFAVPTAAIGSPNAINTLWDVNNNTFLPSDYSASQYEVAAATTGSARTDFTKKVGIVYSETSANLFYDKMAYSQLFTAAQNQATMAGVRYDVLTDADLTNLAKLSNYDALVFPSFANVAAGQVAAIESTLKAAVQQYHIGLIAAGNFMTNDASGAALPGDPYARMKTLLDLQPVNGGFPANVTLNASDITHPMMQDYASHELIHSYTGAGWLAFAPVSTAGTAVLATETVGSQVYNAVIATNTGGRNVHFSSEAVLGDNNLLWQAIDYSVNGSGVTAGVQLSRNASIVASRTDMDQAMLPAALSPESGPGIYDALLPILLQWKAQYNFVGSYYTDIGNNPPTQTTNWTKSGEYYKQILAMGNELGSHTISHPFNTNTLTAAQIQPEFQGSRQIIEQQMSAILGRPFSVEGVAVPGNNENLLTAQSIIQYYDYMSGGFSGVGAGYPGAIGYLTPALAAQDKVYLAPNLEFDFTLVEFKGMTPAQASAEWAREWSSLTSHSDVPVLVWPWHDYAATQRADQPGDPSPYTSQMFTDFISTAYTAGAEFVTLADLADRISAFGDTAVRTSISGSTVTATVTSTDAGRFALDLDNLDAQQIASVAGWYAYDTDSVFLPRNGGTYTIQLGAAATDVTHITALPMRADLISLSGNGTNLSFSVFGEGNVAIDLIDPTGKQLSVAGATVSSLIADKLTLDLGAIGQHDVSVTLMGTGPANHAPTFTVSDGIVGTTFGSPVDEMNDLALQTGNKVVLAGTTLTASGRDFALVRFSAEGSLDPTFDGDGKLTTDFGATDDFAHDLAIQADGKLVVAGYRTNGAVTDFALARYSANGVLDASFGSAGKVTTDFGGAEDIAWAVATQADGKIVVAGHVRPDAGTWDFGVARYNANGTLDATFSGDGKATVDFSGVDVPAAVAIQNDGKIVVAGRGGAGGAALARFNTDGTLDTTFDGDGRAATGLGESFIRGMAVQADGKIVLVGGSYHGGTDQDIVVLRYNVNGSLDATFSGDGIVFSDSGGSDAAYDVAVQSDGRILVSGYSQAASGATNVALLRYASNGTLEGAVVTPAGAGVALALQSDGKMVVGGGIASQPFGAARYLSDGSLDPTFDPVKVNTLNGSVTYAPGGAPVVLDRDVRAYDPDLSGTSYAGASVTLVRSGGANAQDVFSATGGLAALTQGAALVYEGVSVGAVSSNSGGRLTLTFNASATQDVVDHVLQSIGYSNTSATPPAAVQIAWSFSDGNVSAQGSGGALSVSGSSTVTFNHAPTITSNGAAATASISMAENTTAVTTVTASDPDAGPDADAGQTLTYTIAGGADEARFSISAAGALRFATAPNFEAPVDADGNNSYVVQVRVADNGSPSLNDVQTITVNVADANDNAPVITTAAAFSIAENTTLVSALASTDPDTVGTNPAIFSISGGADAARFAISSGNLVFASAPNYESPADSDLNNSYVVQVSASDGANVTSKLITVDVTDVAEGTNSAPVITSNGGGASAALSIAENASTLTTVTATDPDTGQALTFFVSGGADATAFGINATSGVLSFVRAPDYEAPADSGANNVYNVVVGVRDSGGLIDTQALAVTVTNLNGVTLNGDESANVLTGTNENDTLSGNGGNDTLHGLAGEDVLYGGFGNNVLDGGAGADTLQGGPASDIFIWDPADAGISGGGGTDTLRITGSGVTLDLAQAIPRNQIDGIDIVDLTGSGNNTAVLSANELFAMSWDNYLRMEGDAGDRVTVVDTAAWTRAADQTVGTQAYHVWTQSGAQLLIDSDVTTNLV